MSRPGLNHVWAVLLASVLVVAAVGWVAWDQFLHRLIPAAPQGVRVEHPETVRNRIIAWNDAKKVFPEDLNTAWRDAGGQFQWFDLPSICIIRDDLPEDATTMLLFRPCQGRSVRGSAEARPSVFPLPG